MGGPMGLIGNATLGKGLQPMQAQPQYIQHRGPAQKRQGEAVVVPAKLARAQAMPGPQNDATPWVAEVNETVIEVLQVMCREALQARNLAQSTGQTGLLLSKLPDVVNTVRKVKDLVQAGNTIHESMDNPPPWIVNPSVLIQQCLL